MASIKYYVNGAGGTLGAELATLKPLYMSGVIWYVNNSSSAASDSNAGNDRDLPLATLQQAVTNSSAGDMIDLMSGHAETIASTVTINKAGLSIVGEGIGSTLPRLTNNVAAGTGPMISVEAKAILFDSIYFPGSAQSARERIFVGGSPAGQATLANLTFECSANDAQRSAWFNGGNTNAGCSISGSTFTATGVDAGPGLQMGSAIGVTVDSCVFDAGSFNWQAGAGAIYITSGACEGFRMPNTSLLNGSNIIVDITASTGVIQVADESGDSVVDWTP